MNRRLEAREQILNMGEVTELYNDHSDVEVKDKKEERKIQDFWPNDKINHNGINTKIFIGCPPGTSNNIRGRGQVQFCIG